MPSVTTVPGPRSLLESDPAIAERFLGLIRDGVPRAYAALGCGFSYATLYGWVRRGLVPNAAEPYRSFALELYRTEVEVMRGWVTRLGQADKERDGRALEWLLARRFPKAFGLVPANDADPAADVEKELEAAEASRAQLETGGDGGLLDEQRWQVVREWFEAPTPRLLQIARETNLAARLKEEE